MPRGAKHIIPLIFTLFAVAGLSNCGREHASKDKRTEGLTQQTVPQLYRQAPNTSGLESLMQEADTAHDYKMNSLALTEEERQRLKDAYPALEKLSRNPALMEMFWPRVCNNDRWLNPTEIPWSEARTLIMSGCVREISQLHFNGLYILITTSSCERYKAPLERIDQADALLQEIDPKRVFVHYTTQ